MTTSYDSLALNDCDILKCQWGTTGSCAIGFRGKPAEIQKWLNLFANFDFDDESHIPPAPPRWFHEGLAYLTMTNVRLEKALRLFFHCEILRTKEVPIISVETDANPEDENAPLEIETSYDEARVAELSEEYARKFISERIKISSFMMEPTAFQSREYGIMESVGAMG